MDSVRAFPLLLIIAIFVASGCQSSTDETSPEGWTKANAPIPFTEDLSTTGTNEYFFGTITALDVAEDGRMLVADREAGHVKVLAPDASLQAVVGSSGSGPGEFRILDDVQLARGDSIFTYERRGQRVSVFAPSPPYEVARSFRIPRDLGFVPSIWVMDERIVGRFMIQFNPERLKNQPLYGSLRTIAPDGTPLDTLTQHRQQRIAFTSVEGDNFQASTIPFGPSTIKALGPDQRLYVGWNDSLAVTAYRSDGTADPVFSISTDPVPVQSTERDSALQDVPESLRQKVKPMIPDTKPAFTNLVVASDTTVWIQRPPASAEADSVEWWALDPAKQTIRVGTLPRGVDLRVIRDGMAYGSTTGSQGAPTLVRYRVE
jgi:hypothetical protein